MWNTLGLGIALTWLSSLYSMVLVSHYVTLKQEQRVIDGESDLGSYYEPLAGLPTQTINDSTMSDEKTPLTSSLRIA